MKWSFDDNAIGKINPGGSSLATRVIQRPVGLKRSDWYSHAGAVIRLLNGGDAENGLDRETFRRLMEEFLVADEPATAPKAFYRSFENMFGYKPGEHR